jgi:hypothetical protein
MKIQSGMAFLQFGYKHSPKKVIPWRHKLNGKDHETFRAPLPIALRAQANANPQVALSLLT